MNVDELCYVNRHIKKKRKKKKKGWCMRCFLHRFFGNFFLLLTGMNLEAIMFDRDMKS